MNSQVPNSREYNDATSSVTECATKLPEVFSRERNRLLALLSVELGWYTWCNEEEDWTNIVMWTSWYRHSTVFKVYFFHVNFPEDMSVLLSLQV